MTIFPMLSGRCAASLIGLFLALLLLISGCGGFYVTDGEGATRGIHTTARVINHHPDSLGALAIREVENEIRLDLDRDFSSLMDKWSTPLQSGNPVQARSQGTPPLQNEGASHRGRQTRNTYATFWSLELSLASLEQEPGISSLSKQEAQELIEEGRERYVDTIRVDVYLFGDHAINTGPRSRVILQIADSTYQPTEEDLGQLRTTMTDRGSRVRYRRNTYSFPRVVDNSDLLEDADRMSLEVSGPGISERLSFVWRWE